MPPAAPPPPTAVNFDSPEYDALQQKTHGVGEQQPGQIARECMEDVFHSFHVVLHEYEAHKRTVAKAIESCLATCLEVIEMQYPSREDNPVSAISLEHGSWEPEKPPDPCTLDSWLRSALPETMHTVPSTSNRGNESWVMQQFLLKQPSLRRNASARSTGSGRGDPDAPIPAGTAGSDRARAVGVAFSASATGGRSREGGRDGMAGTSVRSLQPLNSRRHVTKLETRKVLTPEQEQLEEQLRQELQQRKTQEEMSRRLEQKDAEERSRLASLRKELKGKDYTYDHKGEVVILNEFDPDRNPLEALAGPGFKVMAPEEANRLPSPKRRGAGRSVSARSAGATSEGTGSPPAAHANMSPSEMRRERDRRLASDFKKMAPRTQPSALETLLPAGGVTLRGAGGATKTGPLRLAATGITREAYAKQVAKRAIQSQSDITHTAPLSPLQTRQGTGHSPRITREGPALLGGNPSGIGADSGVTHVSINGYTAAIAAGRMPLPTAAKDPLAAYADTRPDLFAGVRVRSGRGGVQDAAGQPPPSPDINLSLTSAGDWGMAGHGRAYEAPPALPHAKPTERQLVETVGRVERLPRDRAPLPTLAPPLSPLKIGAPKPSTDRLQFRSVLAE